MNLVMRYPLSQIKLCYVIDNLAFRGGERTLAHLAGTLAQRESYRVLVACSPSGQFVEQLEAAGVRVEPLDMRNRFDPRVILRLVLLMQRERPQIVHIQGGRGNFYGRTAARIAGILLVVSMVQAVVDRYWTRNPLKRGCITSLTGSLKPSGSGVNGE